MSPCLQRERRLSLMQEFDHGSLGRIGLEHCGSEAVEGGSGCQQPATTLALR